MELFQLRYFAAAARELHFTRAAEGLFVSQPSLSIQIRKLEQEVGAPLFHREGKSVRLTDAGRELLPLAVRILELAEEAIAVVQETVGLRRGRLSLLALPALDQHLLPPWLAQFRLDHPEIEIRVREMRPAEAIGRAVAAGDADLGFVHLPCAVEELESRVLLQESMDLVVPDGHRLAGARDIPLEAAWDEDWVWVDEAQTPEHPIYSACLTAGFTPRIACTSGSVQGVLALVAAGLGIALLPRLAIEARCGTAVAPLRQPAPGRTLAVVWRRSRLSHAAREFLESYCLPAAM